MPGSTEKYLWLAVAGILIAFAIPWFLWGNDQVLLGLPIWIWWHIGWMVLTTLLFWVFTNRAWGIGIEESAS